ncbi:unnamed protein product [Lathyrus sativus]|nr:unnamed protein product [Lathyrus sativus]
MPLLRSVLKLKLKTGSQAEVEMDVLAGVLGRINLSQVLVCLTCGDEGFEEAIVYCSKCGDYAMHRQRFSSGSEDGCSCWCVGENIIVYEINSNDYNLI